MAVVRKVQSKKTVAEASESVGTKSVEAKTPLRSKKFCHFCKTKTVPSFLDVAGLRRYLSDRGRIVPRGRLGTCSKHQRRVSREIKRARHLAMLPYTATI